MPGDPTIYVHGYGMTERIIELEEEVKVLRAEIERLRAALAKYGDHTYECSMKDTVGQCTCGYSAELRDDK